MKVAMAGLTVIAAMSAGLYDAAPGQGHGLYNAQAAYGACQEDALRGVHYPMNGDCPNWEAWNSRHMKYKLRHAANRENVQAARGRVVEKGR